MIHTPCTVASKIDPNMAERRSRERADRRFAKRLAGTAALGVLAVLALSAPARADLIDVQFGPTGDTSAYSGAAVLGASGDQWNVVTGTFGNSASGIALKDASGSATPVLLSYSTGLGPGFENVAGSGGIFDGTPYQNLLTTYMDTETHNPITVALSALIPNDSYELVLYSIANRVGAGSTTRFTVDGTSETVVPTSTTALTDGVNYAEFTTTADASGDLSAMVVSGSVEGDLNGFQLLQLPAAAAVPEPASLALLGTALFGLGLIRRRRSTAAPKA